MHTYIGTYIYMHTIKIQYTHKHTLRTHADMHRRTHEHTHTHTHTHTQVSEEEFAQQQSIHGAGIKEAYACLDSDDNGQVHYCTDTL